MFEADLTDLSIWMNRFIDVKIGINNIYNWKTNQITQLDDSIRFDSIDIE